jgi:hypothetical protein
MPSATGADNLPLIGGETTVSPAPPARASTQNGGAISDSATANSEAGGVIDGGVPAMPLPPANAPLAPTDENEAVTPKAVTPAAAAIADPLGAAPEGASQTTGLDGQTNADINGSMNGLTNVRSGSGAPIFARRRTGTGVCSLEFPFSFLYCRSSASHLPGPQ